MDIQKIGKSRYEAKIESLTLHIFRDGYTGLWRIRQEGGPVDWAGPFRTLSEAKSYCEQRV